MDKPAVDVILAGWGQKEGGSFKSWRRRFFILRKRFVDEKIADEMNWQGGKSEKIATAFVTHLLQYFRDPEQAHTSVGATGVVPIIKGRTIITLAPQKSTKCLKLVTPGLKRVYYIVPEDDVNVWMDAVTNLTGDPLTSQLRRMTLGANPMRMIMDVLTQAGVHTAEALDAIGVGVGGVGVGVGVVGEGLHPHSRPGLSIKVDFRPENAGEESKTGDRIWVHYTGTIDVSSQSGQPGMQFDSSIGKQPYALRIGAGQSIQGWELGLIGMCVGEKRTLVIGPEYAYGVSGAHGVIPPHATLRFTIELDSLNEQGAAANLAAATAEANKNRSKELTNVNAHAQCVCDVCHALSGNLNPIIGTRHSKIGCDTRETQYDMCEGHFRDLPTDQKVLFNLISTPGATPIPYKGSAAHVKLLADDAMFASELTKLNVDNTVTEPMKRVLVKIKLDPALNDDEKDKLFALLPPFQTCLEEMRTICVEIFVKLKRFRIATSAEEAEQRLGSYMLDTGSLETLHGWRGPDGALSDGRSIEKAYLEAKRQAALVLQALDPAVQRAWTTAWDEEVKSSETPIDLATVIPQLEAPPGTAQPVPQDKFKEHGWLSHGPKHAADIGPEICGMFEEFVQQGYAGQYGNGWVQYNQERHAALAAESPALAAKAVSNSSEHNRDINKVLQTIVIQLGTAAGVPNGFAVYSLYMFVRAMRANKDFPMHVRQALTAEIPDLEAAGIEVRTCDMKGNSRRDAKTVEYRNEGLPEPASSHVKDILRLTLAVGTVGNMIRCHNAIKARLNVMSVKNRLDSRATRDILMIIRLPDGFLAEVQIHLRAILAIKKHTHKPYKVDRLEVEDCPCTGSLIDVPQWRAENLTEEAIVLTASYTK